MSRHSFDEIVKNFDQLIDNPDIEDTLGYALADWESYGIVGWDEPLNTYFVSLEIGDESKFWAGTEFDEITTFDQLCQVIKTFFGRHGNLFKFLDVIDRD